MLYKIRTQNIDQDVEQSSICGCIKSRRGHIPSQLSDEDIDDCRLLSRHARETAQRRKVVIIIFAGAGRGHRTITDQRGIKPRQSYVERIDASFQRHLSRHFGLLYFWSCGRLFRNGAERVESRSMDTQHPTFSFLFASSPCPYPFRTRSDLKNVQWLWHLGVDDGHHSGSWRIDNSIGD